MNHLVESETELLNSYDSHRMTNKPMHIQNTKTYARIQTNIRTHTHTHTHSSIVTAEFFSFAPWFV